MKTKFILLAALMVIGVSGATWFYSHRQPMETATAADGRKILYYTCSMHPQVREHKPGPCPICGMKLVLIYEQRTDEHATENTNHQNGTVKLDAVSISVINVQTDSVERQPLRRTLHFSGEITWNTRAAGWFEFTTYERDLVWLKIDQKFEVIAPSVPGKIFTAQIKLHGLKSFADRNFDMMTGSTTVRAEILNPTSETGAFGKNRLFNNLHAEAHVVAETEETLTIPRSAVISRGVGPMVYVDKGDGRYAPRAVLLGRVGDEYYEVLAGLDAGEKIVTTGNLLIDSEAQLTGNQ